MSATLKCNKTWLDRYIDSDKAMYSGGYMGIHCAILPTLL